MLALATCQFRFVPQLQNVTKAKGKRNNKKKQKQRKSILQFAKELWATHVYLPKLNLHKKMVTVEGREKSEKKKGLGHIRAIIIITTTISAAHNVCVRLC